jgi:hypothetical protein
VLDDALEAFPAKIFFKGFVVDHDFAVATLNPYLGDGLFAFSRCVKFFDGTFHNGIDSWGSLDNR